MLAFCAGDSYRLAPETDFPLMRAILATLAWLAAVLLIALGGAGLVAGMDTPATTASRPWLTARDDVPVGARLDAISGDLEGVSEQVDALGVEARMALAALVANDSTTAAAALDTGDALMTDIRTRSAQIGTALAAVPLIGTPAAEYRLGPTVRERHARLVGALTQTLGLDEAWAGLATGSASATRLSSLLANHDETVLAAAAQGRDADYAKALLTLDGADAAIADADKLRDQLAITIDVTTLDQWLNRSEDYDKALRELYAALDESGGRVTSAVRAAMAKERTARDRLPPDTRALVSIMAEIGRGGMNGAVIAIEEARGRLADALADPTLTDPTLTDPEASPEP